MKKAIFGICISALLVGAPALAQQAVGQSPTAEDAAENSSRALMAAILPDNPMDKAGILSRADVVNIISARLLAMADVHAVDYLPDEPDILYVTAFRQFQIYLPRMIERLGQDPATRLAALEEWDHDTRRAMADSNPFNLDALRVVVRPTAAIDAFERLAGGTGAQVHVVRRPFLLGLEEVVVAHTGTSMAYLPVDQLTHLNMGASNAFEWGRFHMEALARNAHIEAEDGLNFITLDGNYDSSILLVDRYWNQLAEHLGGAIAVAVPTRGRLIVARADNITAMNRLRTMVRAEAVGEQAISTHIYLRRNNSWIVQ